MKSVYLFCTKPWVYLTELPVIILLSVAIAFNDESEELYKYYPLIVFLIFSAMFIFIYFFRMISVNTDEIRYHGLFSSRDSAFINENKSLVISLMGMGNMRLELFGDASEAPPFEWMKAEDISHRDVCLFRGRAIGGKGSARKILEYFAIQKEALAGCFEDGFSYDDERISISTQLINEVTKIKIKFKVTII